MTRLSDEMLMAYADGALPDAEAARVAAAIEHDTEARAIVAEFRRTAERARAAYAEIITEAVPDSIVRAFLSDETRTANVVDIMQTRKPRSQIWRALLPLAASVVLLIAAAAMFFPRDPGAQSIALGPVPSATPLAVLLETKASGVPVAQAKGAAKGGGHLMVVATFRHRDERICREIEVLDANMQATLAGAACRDPASGTWIVEGTVRIASAPVSHGSTFVPSGTAEKDALDGLLALLGASSAMTADEEQRLIAGAWR